MKKETVVIGNMDRFYCHQCEHFDADPEIEEGLPCTLDDMEILQELTIKDSWFVCGCFSQSITKESHGKAVE